MNSAKILVVEDDLFLRDLYYEILTSENYFVTTAFDGEDALNKMSQDSWDLVLLDIMLPKMSGIDVMKRIKQNSSIPPPKQVVFLTNLSDPNEIHELQDLGNGYLVKSELNPADLLLKVKSFLPQAQ